MFWQHIDAPTIKSARFTIEERKREVFLGIQKVKIFFPSNDFEMSGTSDNQIVRYQITKLDELRHFI